MLPSLLGGERPIRIVNSAVCRDYALQPALDLANGSKRRRPAAVRLDGGGDLPGGRFRPAPRYPEEKRKGQGL